MVSNTKGGSKGDIILATLHKISSSFLKRAHSGKLKKSERRSKYGDGAGLWMHLREDNTVQWSFRYTIAGKRKEMGLGVMKLPLGSSLKSYGEHLSEIRQICSDWRLIVARDEDPMRIREKRKREAIAEKPTFEAIFEDKFRSLRHELKGAGKAGRWDSPVRLHVIPELGHVHIEDIDQHDVKRIIEKIWNKKPETARKALNRINLVLKYAAAGGYDVDIQACAKARELLGKQDHQVEHIASLNWRDVPAFYESLEGKGLTETALQLLILTAARPGEVRACHESEIDGDVWTIPGERMKNKNTHQIPLSKEAQRIITRAKEFGRDGYLFPGIRSNYISDMTLSMYMRRTKLNAKAHGFRTSFRIWSAETTDTSYEVSELALSHKVGSKVQRAYQRSNLLEPRRILMERWADYVTGGSGKLISLKVGF